MWAGSLSHNGLTGCGTGGGDWACHQLEHELGGVYNVTHGAGLAAIWGSWARYVYEVNPERFAQFATNVFDIPCGTDYKETALAGIEAMENFFRSVKMPTSYMNWVWISQISKFMILHSNAVLRTLAPLESLNSSI